MLVSDFNPIIVRTHAGEVEARMDTYVLANTMMYYSNDFIPCSNSTDCAQKCQVEQIGSDPENPVNDR